MAEGRLAVVAGYGTGISAAVAKRFGAEGYKVALLARTQSRLDAAVEELSKSGITAKAYTTDLADTASVNEAIAAIQRDLGPINVLHHNAFSTSAGMTGFRDATPKQSQGGFDVSVTGLVAAVQAALPDLRATKGAVLVTGGGLALEDDKFAQVAVDYNCASLAVAKAAQRKLVNILHKDLAADGIYVGEVTVCDMVKGTLADPAGQASLTAETVADAFWDLLQNRDPAVWFVILLS